MQPIEMLDRGEEVLRDCRKLEPTYPDGYDSLRRLEYREYRLQCTQQLSAAVRKGNQMYLQPLHELVRTQPERGALGLRALALSHRVIGENVRLMAVLSGADYIWAETGMPARRAFEAISRVCDDLFTQAGQVYRLFPPDYTLSNPVDAAPQIHSQTASMVIGAAGSEFSGMSLPEFSQWLRWERRAVENSAWAVIGLDQAGRKADTIVRQVICPTGPGGCVWPLDDASDTLDMLGRFLATTAPLQECARILAATARRLDLVPLAAKINPLAEPVI